MSRPNLDKKLNSLSQFSFPFACLLFITLVSVSQLPNPAVAQNASSQAPKTKAPTLPVCTTDADHSCDDPGKTSSSPVTSKTDLKIKNKNDISPGWHRISPEESMQRARVACEPDVKKYCGKVKDGNGRIATCLANHIKELNPTCQSFVGNMHINSGVPPYLAAPAPVPGPHRSVTIPSTATTQDAPLHSSSPSEKPSEKP